MILESATFRYEAGRLTAFTQSGRTVPMPATRGRRRLLEAVIAAKGEPVSRDNLIGFIWEDHPPHFVAQCLWDICHRLRRDLNERGIRADYLVTTRPYGMAWTAETEVVHGPLVISNAMEIALRHILDVHADRKEAERVKAIVFGR